MKTENEKKEPEQDLTAFYTMLLMIAGFIYIFFIM